MKPGSKKTEDCREQRLPRHVFGNEKDIAGKCVLARYGEKFPLACIFAAAARGMASAR